MGYDLIKDVIHMIEQFEAENMETRTYDNNIEGFKKWIVKASNHIYDRPEPQWEGKQNGRSVDSIINTLIVHMNRYAKSYSKSAILGSDFSSQEDFIYLINMKAFGSMSKMDLIRKNVHEKPVGMQIINRLIKQGWVDQTGSKTDKRSKVIHISPKGLQVLEKQMGKIRQATQVVTGNLTEGEKIELVRLLNKLNDFHQTIYDKNIEVERLLEKALREKAV